MTKKQTALYWREWAKVRKDAPDTDRHALHLEALGYERSSKELSNTEFDKILGAMRAISEPWNINAQMRQMDASATRLRYSITRKAPQAYIAAILRDRFAGRTLDDLDETELTQLRNTLDRAARRQRQGGSATDAYHNADGRERDAILETGTEATDTGDPF